MSRKPSDVRVETLVTLVVEDGVPVDCHVLHDGPDAMVLMIIETGRVLELKKMLQ